MKNKSFIFLISIIIILGGYAFYLNSTENPTSKLKPNSDFAFKNTDEISKIIIKDINNEIITLTKKNTEWIANNSFKARPENIELILKTLKRIKVQSSVPKHTVPKVITDIAAQHKKVEIFTGGSKPVKTFFIGSATHDHSGTFMLLETEKEGRSSTPYIMHIPGFNGFLDSRFFSDPDSWKYTGVFNYKIPDIEKINVTFKNNPKESFQITQGKNGEFNLLEPNGAIVKNTNKGLIKNYILHYKKVHYNKIMDYNQYQIDSVKLIKADYIISVKTKNNTSEAQFYIKANPNKEIDPVTKKTILYDVNYALGCVDNANEIARYQYHVLDDLLVQKSFFINN